MGLRHLGRELALKALYRIDICGGGTKDDTALFFSSFPADERARGFAMELVEGVQREQADLDRQLAEVLEHWSIKRLSRVDHSILLIAMYELLRRDDIPTRVTIDEAIELAKRYGDNESGRFVNGVLDQIAERMGVKQKGENLADSEAD
ncbi:MAG TPA: transcription antitermination factor NusB [Candidatus Binataceae bacterium]|nr:transcription antitermination factor NusB [Candidatus Binataceae bacterium]